MENTLQVSRNATKNEILKTPIELNTVFLAYWSANYNLCLFYTTHRSSQPFTTKLSLNFTTASRMHKKRTKLMN